MLLFLAGYLFGVPCAFLIGWHYRDLSDNLKKITSKQPEKEAFVTRTNPAFTNENRVNQSGSAIVTPKSPQLLEFEEREELRKMNLRPR